MHVQARSMVDGDNAQLKGGSSLASLHAKTNVQQMNFHTER